MSISRKQHICKHFFAKSKTFSALLFMYKRVIASIIYKLNIRYYIKYNNVNEIYFSLFIIIYI